MDVRGQFSRGTRETVLLIRKDERLSILSVYETFGIIRGTALFLTMREDSSIRRKRLM